MEIIIGYDFNIKIKFNKIYTTLIIFILKLISISIKYLYTKAYVKKNIIIIYTLIHP